MDQTKLCAEIQKALKEGKDHITIKDSDGTEVTINIRALTKDEWTYEIGGWGW